MNIFHLGLNQLKGRIFHNVQLGLTLLKVQTTCPFLFIKVFVDSWLWNSLMKSFRSPVYGEYRKYRGAAASLIACLHYVLFCLVTVYV